MTSHRIICPRVWRWWLCLAGLALTAASGCQTLSMPGRTAIRGQSPEPRQLQAPDRPAVAAGTYAEAAPSDVLAGIRVEGNVSIETGAILAQVRSQPGRPADERQIKEDLRTLYATRWFYNVERRFRMEDEGLVLVFRVTERPVVRSVQIFGNEAFSRKQLMKQINIDAGSPYDVASNKAAATRIERFYLDKKSYPDVKVTLESGTDPDDRDVIFVIDEGRQTVVRNTLFDGNSIRDAVLRTRLKSRRTFMGWLAPYSPLGTLFGGKFDETTVPEDVAALKQYYHSLGYFDVAVEKEIDTTGTQIIPEVKLVRNPAEDSRYEHLPIPYLRFRQANAALYRYSVAEGPRYQLRNIEVDGNHIFPTEELTQKFTLRSGDFFNARFLNEDVSGMREKYGALGHVFAKVEAVPRFIDDQPGVVDLVYQIDEDRPYTIRKINVHIGAPGGNPHTRESVVLHPLLFAPGELADPTLIEKSKGRLKGQIFVPTGAEAPQINITRVTDAKSPLRDAIVRGQNPYDSQPRPFNPLYDNSNPGSPYGGGQSPFTRALESAPGEIDVDVSVNEAQSGRLMFGVGVNSNAGVLGQFTLEENNFDITRVPTSWRDVWDGQAFRGNGERFRIEAMPGQLLSRYLISWQTSNFLGTDYTFGVSGSYYNRYLPGWDEERVGGRISLGKQLDKFLSLTAALRLEDVKLDNFATNTPLSLITESRGHSTLSTARFSATHDTRDSGFLPAEGHFLEVAFEQAFGDFIYPRFEVQGTQHFTLHEREDGEGKQVLTLHGEYDWSDSGTPLFERYFAGGYQSFRGFSFRGISPRAGGIRVGGDNMILASAEYSVPVTADEMIRVVGFVDTGTVVDTEDDLDWNAIRATVGFGFRLAIPAMGPAPLAFDFGFPLHSLPEDDERVFTFSLGITR